MFTKTELVEKHKSIQIKPLDFLKIERFYRWSHSWVSSESGYDVYRGSTTNFESAMQFYCDCAIEWDAEGRDFETWKEGWWGWLTNQVSEALCLPISAQEFPKQMNRLLLEVSDVVQLPDMGEFVSALQMQDEWNNIGILAEFETEYLYARWHTGG